MTTQLDRPRTRSNSSGGLPARRAVSRWAWRMFRREWRQQALVLTMLVVAVAATIMGLGLAANAGSGTASQFGSANVLITLPGTSPTLGQDIVKLTERFGTVEVVNHTSIPVPESVTPVDVRDLAPDGPFLAETLRLNDGLFPTAANDIAVTDAVLDEFGLSLGAPWTVEGRTWKVVGLVENPLDLLSEFAVVAPGSISAPETVSVFAHAATLDAVQGLGIDGAEVTIPPAGEAQQAALLVVLLSAIGSIFVGLVAVAGFSVIAQRRLRGIGLLGAVGATSRNLRQTLVANGAMVGIAGALGGLALGLSAWILTAPALERVLNHRIDPFNQSWWAIVLAMALAVVTAVVGSWWPARAASRTPIVAALATRPSPPRAAHRLIVPGAVALAVGLVLVAFASSTKPLALVLGVVVAAVGILLVAPLGISILAGATDRAPVAIRLAVRDLARYRARSGGAVAAVSLAVAIAAAISISAGAAQVAANSAVGGGNLPDDEIAIWLGQGGAAGPIPVTSTEAVEAAQRAVDDFAAAVGAQTPLALEAAVDTEASGGTQVGDNGNAGAPTYDPVELGIAHEVSEGGRTGTAFYGDESIHVFVATSEVLAHYGIPEESIASETDLVTSQDSLDAYEPIPIRAEGWQPIIQTADLPTYTSSPTTLITAKAMTELGLSAAPTGWILDLDAPVTQEQKAQARELARDAGLFVETRPTAADLAPMRLAVTAAGIALALSVLAMTVGLIRSETAQDLSTLAATGASSGIRRTITAATAASLALIGGLMGTLGAYLVLIAWHRRDLSVLSPAPILALLALVVGLPAIAWAVGWLLGGREPATLARRRLE